MIYRCLSRFSTGPRLPLADATQRSSSVRFHGRAGITVQGFRNRVCEIGQWWMCPWHRAKFSEARVWNRTLYALGNQMWAGQTKRQDMSQGFSVRRTRGVFFAIRSGGMDLRPAMKVDHSLTQRNSGRATGDIFERVMFIWSKTNDTFWAR
jgi:hypothetical protein